MILLFAVAALAASPKEIRWVAHYHHGGKKEFVISEGDAPKVNGSRLASISAPLWAADLALVREYKEEKGKAPKTCGAGRYELIRPSQAVVKGCLESNDGQKLSSAFSHLASFTE